MTLDEKFEIYVDLPFLEFLEVMHENGEISYDSLEEHVVLLYPEDDTFYSAEITLENKLKILDELGMYEDLFMDYQKRNGNL